MIKISCYLWIITYRLDIDRTREKKIYSPTRENMLNQWLTWNEDKGHNIVSIFQYPDKKHSIGVEV